VSNKRTPRTHPIKLSKTRKLERKERNPEKTIETENVNVKEGDLNIQKEYQD